MITNSKQTGWLRANVLKAVLLLAASAAVFTVSAQQVALRSKTQTRAQAIEAVKAQGYNVIFNSRDLKEDAAVSFGKTELPLEGVLDKLAEGTGLSYAIDGKSIVFYRSAGKQNASVVTVSTDRNIAGTVNDADGKPMEGVTVEAVDVKGKTATTFVNGRFRIEGVSSGNHILKLTSADGQTIRYREVNVATGKDADVTLTLAGAALASAPATEEAATASPAKTTAWFVPNMKDNTVHALSDEPKTQYSFIPSGKMDEMYMPKAAVKTNLLILGTATPNVAVELALAKRWTLDLSAAYNPFQLEEGGVNYLTVISPEFRYWFCQRFEKHFVGLHLLGGTFNIGDVTFLTKTFETHRYDGWGAGAGLSYGYHLPMAKRWAWEFTVGAGYVYLEYDKYRCYDCDEYMGRKSRHYFGPTKAGVSLIYMIR